VTASSANRQARLETLGQLRDETSTKNGQIIDPADWACRLLEQIVDVNMLRAVIGIIGSDRSVAR
jgi:hypothetical protein